MIVKIIFELGSIIWVQTGKGQYIRGSMVHLVTKEYI